MVDINKYIKNGMVQIAHKMSKLKNEYSIYYLKF